MQAFIDTLGATALSTARVKSSHQRMLAQHGSAYIDSRHGPPLVVHRPVAKQRLQGTILTLTGEASVQRLRPTGFHDQGSETNSFTLKLLSFFLDPCMSYDCLDQCLRPKGSCIAQLRITY